MQYSIMPQSSFVPSFVFLCICSRVAVRVMSQEQASKRTGEKQTDNFLNCLRDVMYDTGTLQWPLHCTDGSSLALARQHNNTNYRLPVAITQ